MSDAVEFYFDFISPFGYLASLRIDAVAQAYGRDCVWRSMLLGISVLKVMGMKPLRQTPMKGDYLRRDMLRYSRRHGIAIGRDIDAPPANPIPAGRAFHWVLAHDPALAKPVARALLAAYWGEGRDIGNVDVVAGIVGEFGADGFRAALADGSADALLRAAVDASLRRGVFGSPFFFVGDEPFFGLEKLPLLEEWLASGGW